MSEHSATPEGANEAPLVVVKNPAESRYEARAHGQLIGLASYVEHGKTLIFDHTEVAEAFQSLGVGGVLARAAMDDVRAQGGYKVIPRCPFIKNWLDRHPEYSDLRHGTATSGQSTAMRSSDRPEAD